MAAQGSVFSKRNTQFRVFITFVGGDDHHRLDTFAVTAAFKEIHRPHDVGFKGGNHLTVRKAHQGLGGEMENDFGLEAVKNLLQFFTVADVAKTALHRSGDN